MHCECNVHHKYMTAVVTLLENIKSNSMVSLKFVITFYVCLRWSKGSSIWCGVVVQFEWAFMYRQICPHRNYALQVHTHTHTHIPPEYLQWIYIIRPYYCSALHYNQASVPKLSTWIYSIAPEPHPPDRRASIFGSHPRWPPAHTNSTHEKRAEIINIQNTNHPRGIFTAF